MPLPWRLPTDREADEQYRRIHQLIADLLLLLRHIIFGHRLPIEENAGGGGNAAETRREAEGEEGRDSTMPDLVAHLAETRLSDQNDMKPKRDDDQPPMR